MLDRAVDIARLAETVIPSGVAANPLDGAADPDQDVIAQALVELDKLTLQAECLTAQRTQIEAQMRVRGRE